MGALGPSDPSFTSNIPRPSLTILIRAHPLLQPTAALTLGKVAMKIRGPQIQGNCFLIKGNLMRIAGKQTSGDYRMPSLHRLLSNCTSLTQKEFPCNLQRGLEDRDN